MKPRTLRHIPGDFAMTRLEPHDAVPDWALTPGTAFTAITRTAQELSLIAPRTLIPEDREADSGWSCLMLEGPFALDEPGIAASVVDPLAAAGLSVFVVATFDTDYFLVTDLDAATRALTSAGHLVLPAGADDRQDVGP